MEKFFNNNPQKEQKENKIEKPQIKEGVDFVFEQNPELANIGTMEQYSEYLDTIFSDSKVKDIVYHSTTALFEDYDIERGDLGMHFSEKNVSAGILYSKYTKANLINIKNPLQFVDFGGFHFTMFGKKFVEADVISKDEFSSIDNLNLSVKEEDKLFRELLLSKGFDGVMYLNRREGIDGGILNGDEFYKNRNLNDTQFKEKYPDASNSYIVFKPEQTHILGSIRDITMFKEFIKN